MSWTARPQTEFEKFPSQPKFSPSMKAGTTTAPVANT